MREIIRGSRFDSFLHLAPVQGGHHANLTIHMKVCLQQFAPPAGQSTLRYEQRIGQSSNSINISNWEASDDWPGWCREFERGAEDFFNNKLWLVADRSWIDDAPVPGSGGRSVYFPAVRCVFRISRVSMSDCHFIADVAKTVGDSGAFRASQSQVSARREASRSARDSVGFADNPLSTIYRACFAGSGRLLFTDDSLDDVPYTRDSVEFRQRTYLHELGHAIGLSHIGGPGNEDERYGANTHDREDLMGLGERISAWHTFPWKRRLEQHLRSRVGVLPGWTATTRPPAMRTAPPPVVQSPSTNGPIGLPGGVPLDGGVASGCAVRGCTHRGTLGLHVAGTSKLA